MSAGKVTQELLDELEAKHKRIAHVKGKDGEWETIFRRPTRAEYKRFRSQLNDPMHAADAAEQLARQCIVHPSPEAFDALLEEWPAIPEAASRAFLRLVGAAAEHDGK